MSPLVSVPFDWIWAYNSSLEPPRIPYEQSMGNIRFARAARPQGTKLCFLLHKLTPNGYFEACINSMNCRSSRKIDFPKIVICIRCALRPQCSKIVFFYYISHFKWHFLDISCYSTSRSGTPTVRKSKYFRPSRAGGEQSEPSREYL